MLTPDSFRSEPLANIARTVARTPGGATALTRACLDRIAALDSEYRCMTELDVTGALLRAAELDATAPDLRGPLHGVPLIVKELFDVAGLGDSNGSDVATPELHAGEGSLVGALRAAGCVVLGKSRSTEFAFGQLNIDRALPVNPCDRTVERATGGSSAGSAAALALGYCAVALGTDTGGSVRAPAALCGVVGFKPSEGAWPNDGIFPLSSKLDTPGVFVNSVADAMQLHGLVAGGTYTARRPARLGVVREPFFASLGDLVAQETARALETITGEGIELVELAFPALDLLEDYFGTDLPRELLARLGVERVRANWSVLDRMTRARLEPFLDEMPGEGATAELPWSATRAAVETALAHAGVDAWLAPAVPVVAPPLSDFDTPARVFAWQDLASRNTRLTSLLGHSAVSLPLRSDRRFEALPVGLQVAAPADAAVLETAAYLDGLL